MAEAFKYKHLKNFLKIWSNEVVNEAKDNLRKAGKGGGELERSIKAEIVDEGETFAVKFVMADYGTFVDKGVKGAGGEIKTGEFAGTWGGRRWFKTYEDKRLDSPYKFGTGTGRSGGMRDGIAAFVRKKNLTPNPGGTIRGLEIAIMKVLWVKGIHGISFFQNSLMMGLSSFDLDMPPEVKEDIIDTLVTFPNIERA